MKYLSTITLCLFFSIAFISCEEEDDETMMEDPIVENTEQGEWTVSTFTFEVTASTSFMGIDFSSTTSGVGKNLNYDLKLEDGEFTTTGAYDLEITTVTLTTEDPMVTSQSYTDVNGEGSYTIDGDQMTIDGQFFDFEFNGEPFSSTSGPATATFIVEGDELTFTQEEESSSTVEEVISTTKIISTSVWTRK